MRRGTKSQNGSCIAKGSNEVSARIICQANRQPKTYTTTMEARKSISNSAIIMTIAAILVLIVAATTVECHYHKRTQYHEQVSSSV